MFLSTLPETAFAKSFQKRKGDPGYMSDTIGVFERKMRNMSHQVANMRFNPQLSAVVNEMADLAKAQQGMQTADVAALESAGQAQQAQQQAELTPVQNPFPEDEHTSDVTGGVYVPPLQQKMELLKKMAGVDSVYDEPGEEPSANGGEPNQVEDPLNAIRRMAGMPAAVKMAVEDDDVME